MKFSPDNNGMTLGSGAAEALATASEAIRGIQALPSEVTSRIFSFESIDTGLASQADVHQTNLTSAVAKMRDRLNAGKVLAACEEAAIQGFMMSNAAGAMTGARISSSIAGDSRASSFKTAYKIGAENAPDYVGKRNSHVVAALESFNPTEQRNAALYTFAFNYVASRQEEYGETLYPTLTLPQDQVGFGIIVNRLTIHKGWLHKVDGKEVSMGKIDLVRAARNHEVLSRQKTRVVPVVRADSVDAFVPAALIAPSTKIVDGVSIQTAPLKIGQTVNLLGLSQTDAQILGGLSNQTDTLEPAIYLENIYVKFGDDVLKFYVQQRHGANFVYGQQGFNEKRRLSFDGGFLTMTADTKNFAGAAVTNATLAKLAADSLVVVFGAYMNGDFNTESGNGTVYGNAVKLNRVMEKAADGSLEELAKTNALYVEFETLIASASIIGYDLVAWKSNVNMRENGDLIDRSQFIQLYEVPLLSPVTAQKPLSSSNEGDGSDFETLVTTTRFRLYTDVVTAQFTHMQAVKDFCDVPIKDIEAPEGLGASRFHVKPAYAELVGANAIDCTKISGNNTYETIKNLQAHIVNKLRDMAFSLYRNSEYQAAQMALGQVNKPTLAIATDTIISRYILVDGELRTLTDRFDYRVVSTLDKRMDNKIFITFVDLGAERNQTPNILAWGNLIWGAESVISANMPRNGGNARETIVQPRYLFANHLPVCGWIEVTNLNAVFDQSFLRTKAA